MKIRSNAFCLSLATFLALLGCDFEKKSNTQDPAGVTKTSLELKPFQYIKNPGSPQKTVYSTEQIDKHAHLSMLDQIGMGSYSSEISLIVNIKCAENQVFAFGAKDKNPNTPIYTRRTETPFIGPISLFQLVPEELLYRLEDKSVDGLHCALDLLAKDPAGNSRALESAIIGRFIDKIGYAHLLIKEKYQSINPNPDELDTVFEEQLHEYSLQGEQNLNFSSYKMQCETFVTEGSLNRDSFFEFQRLNFSENTKGLSTDASAPRHRQTCRMFAYDNKKLVGYSPYFIYEKKYFAPVVEATYRTSSSGFSSPLSDKTAALADHLNVGSVFVSNPHSHTILVKVQDADSVLKAQLHSVVAKDQNPSRWTIKGAAQLTEGHPSIVSSPSHPGQKIFVMPPASSLQMNYFFYMPPGCHRWRNTIFNLHPTPGGLIAGALFQITPPVVSLMESQNTQDPMDFQAGLTEIWTWDSASSPQNEFRPEKFHYIHANAKTQAHNPTPPTSWLPHATDDLCLTGTSSWVRKL